jgi:predicted phosphodiesterase
MDEKVIKKLRGGFCTLDDLGLTHRDIERFKKRGFDVQKKGRHYFIPSNTSHNYLVVSTTRHESTEVLTADISDTHAGCNQFNERGLREFLETAEREGVKTIHHSGDLVDGYGVYRGQLMNLSEWKAEDQAGILAKILNDYPFNVIAIKGNHDMSFEAQGGLPVGKILEKMCTGFVYLDDVFCDIVQDGVLKRMVHGASGRAYARSYPSQVYIRELMNGDRGHRKLNGHLYRIQVLQMGHYHTDMNYETAGIQVIHPGNFQGPTEFTTRRGLMGPQGGRITKMKVKNGEIQEFESRFVRVKDE